jgi:hypothetical protein
MKLSKISSFLIIIMISFSLIYSLSSEEQTQTEMQKLMKQANSNDFDNDSDLDKFYLNENNKFKNNDKISLEGIRKNKNKQEIDTGNNEIQLLEMKSNIKANSKNTNRHKKTKDQKNTKKENKNYPTAKLINQYNPWLPKKREIINANTEEKYCTYKHGFLYLVKDPKKLGDAPLSIHTVPVFVSLTMESLNVQMGVELKTLFALVKTVNILKITKKFKNANCFEILEDDIVEESLSKNPIVLCASNSKSLANWVRALQQFKDCIYNTDSKMTETETLIDFNRVNQLLKTPKGKVTKFDEGLFYDKAPLPIVRKETRIETVMKTELEKIVGLLERGRINEMNKKRTMDAKLKGAENIEKDIRNKKAMIDKILDTRANKDKENDEKLKADEEKKRELQLLKAVRARISQYKVS